MYIPKRNLNESGSKAAEKRLSIEYSGNTAYVKIRV
jgi:hypothetical protein